MTTGCKVAPPKPPLVKTVAVLLFDNESNDLNAPDLLQGLVWGALKKSPYDVLDRNVVNEKLGKAGIVDGGQLPALDPAKLGKDLGVQALLYGSVESFAYTNIGFYLQRKVAVSLRLVDVTSGQTLWENEGTGVHREVHLNQKDAQDAFARGLATQAVDKIAKLPLQEEAEAATINGLSSLPGYHFAGFARTTETATGVQRGVRDVTNNVIQQK